MVNDTFPIPHQEIHNNTGLLWMLHAPFWQQMFFVLLGVGIALFIHAMSTWTDWNKIKKEIIAWVLWMQVVELPMEKEKRRNFFLDIRNRAEQFTNNLLKKSRENYEKECKNGNEEICKKY